MFESAFVVLREAAELLLIVMAIYTFLHRAARLDATGALWVGLVAGLGSGALLVAVVALQSWGPREHAWLSIGMGTAVMAMAVVMLSSRHTINTHVDNLLDAALEGSGTRWLVGGVAAFSALRETAETGVFLLSAAQTHGLGASMAGVALGLGVAAVGVAVFRHRRPRIPLLLIYRISTLLLCLLSIQLVLDGAGVLLVAAGSGTDPMPGWVAALQTGTREYNVLCTALMVPPLLLIARRWWREAGGLSS